MTMATQVITAPTSPQGGPLGHLVRSAMGIAQRGPRMLLILVLALLALGTVSLRGAAIAHASPSTYEVNTTADQNTGSEQLNCTGFAGVCTLRAAITDANKLAAGASVTIDLPAGTYNITEGELDLFGASNQTIAIVGDSAAATIINGDGKRLIFAVNLVDSSENAITSPHLSLSQMTIQDGRDDSTYSGGVNAGAGGGGLIAGGNGDQVTIDDCVFQNNSANDGAGGAISWQAITGDGGKLAISNTTFTNNNIDAPSSSDSSSSGGAISFNGGDQLSITNSVFTDNSAGPFTPGQGGAIAMGSTSSSIANPAFAITNSTFTGNTASGTGAVGSALWNQDGTLLLQFNRIVDNTPSTSEIYQQADGTSSGTIDGTENWWGTNDAPFSFVGRSAGATFPSVDPWIVLTTTPDPKAITVNQTTTLTADVLHLSSFGTLTASQVSALIGLPVTWGSAVDGTLSDAETTIQANGTATATFTATAAGAGSAAAVVDNATSTVAITISQQASSTITLTVPASTINYGASATFTATVAPSQTTTLISSGTVTFYDDGTQIGTGTLNTSTPDTATFTTSTLSLGTHSITASYAGDANFAGSGPTAAQSVLVQAPTTALYTGPQLVIIPTTLTPSAQIGSPAATCMSTGTVTFTLDRNPLTGVAGTYSLGSAAVSSSAVTAPPVATTGWQEGEYTVTATYGAPAASGCLSSLDTATLTAGGTGDSANGGGWTTVPGIGRVNFGFTAQQVPNTNPTQYKGQFMMINTGKWRLKGTLSSYTKTSSNQAAVSGTGDLYWWNSALNGGLGDWQLYQSGVSFTVSVTDNGTNLKANPDLYGQHINATTGSPYPTIPNFAPQAIKGGNITVR